MAGSISDEQAAEYLEAYTKFKQATSEMKRLGYSKTELKNEIDLTYR